MVLDLRASWPLSHYRCSMIAMIQLVEGAITILFGFLAWFHLPDFPDKNTFLTIEQTTFIIGRIERDRGDSLPDPITKSKVLRHLCDWVLWVYGGLTPLDFRWYVRV